MAFIKLLMLKGYHLIRLSTYANKLLGRKITCKIYANCKKNQCERANGALFNAIDGHFADSKNKLRNHNGLSIARKKKFIDEFLKA